MPNGATSGRARLRASAPGQHSSEETLQRWQTVGDDVFDYSICASIQQ